MNSKAMVAAEITAFSLAFQLHWLALRGKAFSLRADYSAEAETAFQTLYELELDVLLTYPDKAQA